MTDLVNTDALRGLSKWLYDESQYDKSLLVGDAADEADRLRAVVENAPHHRLCPSRWFDACTCWKADAL